MLSAEQIVQKWQRNATSGNARQAYVDGTQSITVSPMEQAAAADQLFLDRVTQSVTSGRRAAKLRATPLQVYKDGCRAKADRFSSGITAAQQKYAAAMTKWAGVYQQASQAAAAIRNDGSTASQLAKVEAAINVMKAAAGRT